MTKLIFLSGSTRKGSYNTALAKAAYEMASEDSSVEAELIDLADYEMPIFNEDLEAAEFPENTQKLKDKFKECDGFFISSPEYNSSISPLLKNALDWISRQGNDEKGGLIAYAGKVAALGAASPGGFGGLRGLVPLRMMLGNIQVHVIPNQIAIAQAHEVFNESGKLVDEKKKKLLSGIVSKFIETTKKVSS